ncbi:phosphoribosyl-ATP pyrophosphatase [Acetobacter sp.]|jgi:phosphoribosyl-ATP pyrophosphohydrolase|uniref:phosphoribosyl-ATP pyrophosphatase n=1 Tax=Acetobacter sp. TaxID=440 RepID=UPI0025BD8760|nr:phosphoribosyl-ATP pyrophosphatase [Acetobacter sp.]MCH4092591.1 phosphoribosyl-ATP pyrophosphatase [Acetobacter sp.]MCI1299725.1 phosphoribosyl-ATP pyrophosphatase [Acetobacter sp.]MCI1315395.1 phosphoribosyl-ATP pyrophosphatase [Acetobacter sp.]
MTIRSSGAVESLAPLLHALAQQERERSDDAKTRRLARTLGLVTAECATAVIEGDREEVVRSSAGFIRELVAIWADQGLDPDAVWTELHCRIEMGELCLRLSRASGPHKGRRKGPWRVATSKLP